MKKQIVLLALVLSLSAGAGLGAELSTDSNLVHGLALEDGSAGFALVRAFALQLRTRPDGPAAYADINPIEAPVLDLAIEVNETSTFLARACKERRILGKVELRSQRGRIEEMRAELRNVLVERCELQAQGLGEPAVVARLVAQSLNLFGPDQSAVWDSSRGVVDVRYRPQSGSNDAAASTMVIDGSVMKATGFASTQAQGDVSDVLATCNRPDGMMALLSLFVRASPVSLTRRFGQYLDRRVELTSARAVGRTLTVRGGLDMSTEAGLRMLSPEIRIEDVEPLLQQDPTDLLSSALLDPTLERTISR